MSRRRRPRCIVLGGGGHARVVMDAIFESGCADLAGILDKDGDLHGGEILGVRVHGPDGLLPELARRAKADHFVVGLGSVRDNRPRAALYRWGVECGLNPLTVIHPKSFLSPRAAVGSGSVLLAGSVVNAGARVGDNAIINSGAVVEHDCVVGDHVHIATRAAIASTVKVESFAHIGLGAVVRQCLTVGEGAVVGAGAAVIRDVAPGALVVGVPAEVKETSSLIETR